MEIGRKEEGREEGNVLFYKALNTFYLQLYGDGHNLVKGQKIGRKEGRVLFYKALNTFYLRLYGVEHMVKGQQIGRKEGKKKEERKEVRKCFILQHFIYSYMVLDIW